MFQQVHQSWHDSAKGSYRLILDETGLYITPLNALAATRLRQETERVLQAAQQQIYIRPFNHNLDDTDNSICNPAAPVRYAFKLLPAQPDYNQQIQEDAGVNALLDEAEGYLNKIEYAQKTHGLAGVYQGYIELIQYRLEAANRFQLTDAQSFRLNTLSARHFHLKGGKP